MKQVHHWHFYLHWFLWQFKGITYNIINWWVEAHSTLVRSVSKFLRLKSYCTAPGAQWCWCQQQKQTATDKRCPRAILQCRQLCCIVDSAAKYPEIVFFYINGDLPLVSDDLLLLPSSSLHMQNCTTEFQPVFSCLCSYKVRATPFPEREGKAFP